MLRHLKTAKQRIVVATLAGFLVGAGVLVALRFATYKSSNVHYHANFALYINGQRDELKNFTFYEEVQSCGSDQVNNPRTRVHLHDNINSVVHVHDAGATWSALFANLGYALGDQVLQTDSGTYVDAAESKQLTFWLNGEAVDGIANRTITSKDSLLISYGNEDQTTLQQQFDAIVKDAADYNERNDPSSCTGTKPITWREKLKASIGIN